MPYPPNSVLSSFMRLATEPMLFGEARSHYDVRALPSYIANEQLLSLLTRPSARTQYLAQLRGVGRRMRDVTSATAAVPIMALPIALHGTLETALPRPDEILWTSETAILLIEALAYAIDDIPAAHDITWSTASQLRNNDQAEFSLTPAWYLLDAIAVLIDKVSQTESKPQLDRLAQALIRVYGAASRGLLNRPDIVHRCELVHTTQRWLVTYGESDGRYQVSNWTTAVIDDPELHFQLALLAAIYCANGQRPREEHTYWYDGA